MYYSYKLGKLPRNIEKAIRKYPNNALKSSRTKNTKFYELLKLVHIKFEKSWWNISKSDERSSSNWLILKIIARQMRSHIKIIWKKSRVANLSKRAEAKSCFEENLIAHKWYRYRLIFVLIKLEILELYKCFDIILIRSFLLLYIILKCQAPSRESYHYSIELWSVEYNHKLKLNQVSSFKRLMVLTME